jgi:hypothetical protein
MSSKPLIKICCWLVLVFALTAGVRLLLSHRPNGGGKAVVPVAARILPATNAVSARPVAGSNSTVPSALELARRGALFSSFQKHPFAAAQTNAAFGWTAEDGKNPDVIHQLAHNELEFERMAGENDRIYRRQLVYLNETAAAVFEQAKLTGKPVQQLTLPGIDGQEFLFEIVKSDSNGSSRQGMFSGHLAGNPDSLVTMAFQDGRQAFTILSPKENIYVVGEPREDGQVIVKAIDPNTYGLGPEEADDHFVTVPTNK